MDRVSTRWHKVPIPPLHSHFAFIGRCYENSIQDRLCVKMRSLNLPGPRPQLPFPTPPSDGPPEKQARISAHAPPRRPPAPAAARQSSSKVIAALDAANVLGCAACPSFFDIRSLCVRLPPPTNSTESPAPPPSLSTSDDGAYAEGSAGPSTRAKGKRKASN
jgi:hypothetical protein